MGLFYVIIQPMQIIHGDCLEVLKTLDTDSVDLVFYDPPYNVKKKYDGYKDNKSPNEYLQWMIDVYNESDRVSRNGVVVYVAGKLTHTFFDIMKNPHLVIVYKRAAGVVSNNYMLQYHSILSTCNPVVKCRDVWDDVRLPGEGYYFREDRYDNPGLTGLEMTKKVLQHFTKVADIVLDPFCGTGTTLVACKATNRRGIGIEQSSKYIEIANKRLSEEVCSQK
jgi:DNA modification methylase